MDSINSFTTFWYKSTLRYMCCHAYVNLETRRKLVPKLSRDCFWDCYWGRTGQLLGNFSRRVPRQTEVRTALTL